MFIEPIPKSVAKAMIIKNHYSHCWTSCNVALGLFVSGSLVGTAVFGYPTGRPVVKSISDTLSTRQVFELTRLWLEDAMPKNTESWFISKCIDWIAVNRPEIKCLVSYADPGQSHMGIIYQATNFYYQKITKTLLLFFNQWVSNDT